MSKCEREKIIRTEIEPKIDELVLELDKNFNLETIEDGEKLHRELSFISTEDLFRPFTI